MRQAKPSGGARRARPGGVLLYGRFANQLRALLVATPASLFLAHAPWPSLETRKTPGEPSPYGSTVCSLAAIVWLGQNVCMQRDDALRLLREHGGQLRSLGVARLFLYGSVARNKAREDSDVDLLVEPLSQKFSIFDLVRVRDQCQKILGGGFGVAHTLSRQSLASARSNFL